MGIKDCKDRLKEVMKGRPEEEVNAVFKEAAKIFRNNENVSPEELAANIGNILKEAELDRKIRARSKIINELAKSNMRKFIDGFDDPIEGMESYLVGVNKLGAGNRNSVAALQESLKEGYLSKFSNGVAALGRDIEDAFTRGDLDDSIVDAMWASKDPKALAKIDPRAVKVAEQLKKVQNIARVDANRAGSFIGEDPSYVVRQTHDMDKIRAADEKEWIKEVTEMLDPKTFDGVEDIQEFMESVYFNLSLGHHHGSGSVGGGKSRANIATRTSQERVLHFKDSASYKAYHKKYGRGSLPDLVMSGLMMSAQNTALMRKMGTNPRANFESVMEEVTKKVKKSQKGKGTAKIKWENHKVGVLDNYFRTVSGETSIPASQMSAEIGQYIRGINTLKMLGGVVMSAIPDTAFSVAELNYQGRSVLSNWATMIGGVGGFIGDTFKSIKNNKLTPLTDSQRRVMKELEISLDSMTGAFRSRFDANGDPLNGRVSSAMRTFFRYNGLTLWTDSMRGASMVGMSHHLGSYVGSKFTDIHPDLARVLNQYNIGKLEWEVINKVGAKTVEGADGKYLTPESMMEASDNTIRNYVHAKGVKTATQFQMNKAREELRDSLRTFYVDRSQYAVIEPDKKTQAMTLRGTQAGTIGGEVLRHVMQFKSFPFAVMQKVYGREILGRESAVSSAVAMSQLIVASTLLGYISTVLADIGKNKTPRDPEELETWVASFLKGGGAGIWGDFLFGDLKSRTGNDPLTTFLGPTFSQGVQGVRALGDLKESTLEGEGEEALSTVFKAAYKNAPTALSLAMPQFSLLNTFYSKAAMDNLIFYNVMESLDPGYKREMEKRMKSRTEQEFLIK